MQHLPGVGQNLQDHLELYVAQKCKKPVTLLGDQRGLKMVQVGLQWFLNSTGWCLVAVEYIVLHKNF